MKLSRLISSLKNTQVSKHANPEITGIVDDSRKTVRGCLFVAIRGLNFDGNDFINMAISGGARAVVSERKMPGNFPANVVYVEVSSAREALSLLSSRWYRDPSKKLKVLGITGTDGKTTAANLIYEILIKAGKNAGLISTIGAKIEGKDYDTGLHVTNPEPLELQSLLSKMVEEGCEYAVLEVTSQGLDQKRVYGIEFLIGLVTNITREHLDYHMTFDNYINAKAKLFDQSKFILLNKEDSSSKKLVDIIKRSKNKNKKIIFYSHNNLKGEVGRFSKKRFNQLYNLQNTAAAICVAESLNISQKEIAAAILNFPSLSGRLEEIKNKRGYRIYIDFAHTPNAVTNVLEYLRKKAEGRLICVFGSAGERDRGKRKIMGEIVARFSDVAIVTSEDPRSEDPDKIIFDITKGLGKQMVDATYDKAKRKGKFFLSVKDRGKAIFIAINEIAKNRDTIAILGKGHEKSINVKGIEYPWSDRKAVGASLNGEILSVPGLVNIHFMGIGGSGISAAAALAAKLGFKVDGCDLETRTAYIESIRDKVDKIYSGHSKDHLSAGETLVVSPAVFFQNAKNPELVFGQKHGKVITWQEFLSKNIPDSQQLICVSGTHGKSTTTALASHTFEIAGRDPSAVVGAEIPGWGANFRFGDGSYFILEADEFYDNFLNFNPNSVVINNIEFDHPDYFENDEKLIESFAKFIKRLPLGGNLIVNQDSLGIQKLFREIEKDSLGKLNVFGYTMTKKPKLQIKNTLYGSVVKLTRQESVFRVSSKALAINQIYKIKIPGKFNIENSLGVILLAKIYSLEDKHVKKALSGFCGIKRRMELVWDGFVEVYDDYAHHPTAIRETLQGLRQRYPKQRIWAVVEAHSFSRTRALLKGYKGVFDSADYVLVGPIFKARDNHSFGVSEKSILTASKHKNGLCLKNSMEIVNYLLKNIKKGDVIMVMGAGKSYLWAEDIVKAVKNKK